MEDFTRKFNAAQDKSVQIHHVLTTVYEALKEKGGLSSFQALTTAIAAQVIVPMLRFHASALTFTSMPLSTPENFHWMLRTTLSSPAA